MKKKKLPTEVKWEIQRTVTNHLHDFFYSALKLGVVMFAFIVFSFGAYGIVDKTFVEPFEIFVVAALISLISFPMFFVFRRGDNAIQFYMLIMYLSVSFQIGELSFVAIGGWCFFKAWGWYFLYQRMKRIKEDYWEKQELMKWRLDHEQIEKDRKRRTKRNGLSDRVRSTKRKRKET